VDGSAEYILTGSWGKKALEEAQREGPTRVVWDGKSEGYRRVPHDREVQLADPAAYVHFTSNETIEGVQFGTPPISSHAPLVCDASSDFLSRPIPVDQFGLIYACAQKNAGPAGVTVVIVRGDLLERSQESLPGYLNYRVHAENGSMWNTPPTFGIYVLDLVAQWLDQEIGGLEAMHLRNREKAYLLYEQLDQSGGFYSGHAEPDSRSLMNVTFRLPSAELEGRFLQEAADRGLTSLKGHRSVGGIRASVYNAMPREGVVQLREFMAEFQRKHA
jgi:phosphoserine aminotransferase